MDIFLYGARFFEEMYKIHKEAFNDEALTRSEFLEEILCPSRRYFIGVDGNEVVGYIGAWNTKSDYSIISIAIKKECQGLGYAKQLIKRVEEDAKMHSIYAISLEVNEENKKALSLYRSQGFMVTNTRKNYYKGGKSAHIMWKYL